MKQVDIEITKTGRYFVSTEPSKKIKQLWIVCHGYGQLANYFLKWFEPIFNEETLVVAPEGLHRFYWNGFSGNVVASWMTKEERKTDINDYVRFLNQVADEILNQLPKNVQINILGFSQGTATVCRWINDGKIKPDNLIIWAGAFPDDIDYFENKELFNSINIKFAVGDKDEFYTEEVIEKEFNRLNNKELNFEIIRYQGGHKILPNPLEKIAQSLKANE